jgi:hypothetical protein
MKIPDPEKVGDFLLGELLAERGASPDLNPSHSPFEGEEVTPGPSQRFFASLRMTLRQAQGERGEKVAGFWPTPE